MSDFVSNPSKEELIESLELVLKIEQEFLQVRLRQKVY